MMIKQRMYAALNYGACHTNVDFFKGNLLIQYQWRSI